MRKYSLKIIGFFVVFCSLFSLVFSIQPEISINETSSLKDLRNGQFSLSAEGIVSIYNPSNFSRIYEYTLPLNLGPLIGINKISIDNSSQGVEVSYNEIKGKFIEVNDTVSFGYKIYGLTSSNLYNALEADQTIFEYYVEDYELVGKAALNLKKPQREGEVYNESGELVNFTQGSNSTRLISAGIRNPTDFEYFLDELKLFKTEASDPFFSEGDLLSTFSNISISPFGFEEVDFFDETSIDNSVYWMSADLKIISNISSSFTRSFSVVPSSSGGGGGGGSSSGSNQEEFFPDEDNQEILDSVLIKKSVDKSVVRRGEEFQVILRIVNINDFEIEDLKVSDQIPQNYEIKEISGEVSIQDRNLEFTIDSVDAYETYVITYTLVNNAQNAGVTFLKPAILEYLDESLYSEGVLIINELLPDKKVFVQKEIKIQDSNFARVTLKVKNLGNIELTNLLISDDIPEDVLVKELSKIFKERGLWEIKELKAGEEWEVSYLVERNPSLDNLPNVFGVDQENVFGTLISSEEVITIFQGGEPKIIEKVGLGLAVGLLIVYLLF